jgi:ADP-ribose pyrophosphatase YjhB (NUDIX family)
MNLRLNANAIVTNSAGKILFVKLKKGPFAGGLCIPGGGINPGELCEEAIKREVFEETRVKLEDKITPIGFCELMHTGVQDHRVVLLMHSTSDAEPEETEEGHAVWLSYGEAEKSIIPFAHEAIKMWRAGKGYFRLIGDETGITKKWA